MFSIRIPKLDMSMAIEDLEKKDELLIDLGLQPVSNRFLPAHSNTVAPHFPLQLRVNKESGLIHLGTPFPLAELKPRYDWITCFEPEDHLDELVERVLTLPGVTKNSVFGAFSFKDDSTLRRLERRGYEHNWRIDPRRDLDVTDLCASIETYQHAFTPAKAREIQMSLGSADVLIVRHVIEHVYDLCGFMTAVRTLLKPGGYIVFEVPDCTRALTAGDCTSIWEEHIYYFTRFTFEQVMRKQFDIVQYYSVPYTLEDSLVAIVREGPAEEDAVQPDRDAVDEELVRARTFALKIADHKLAVHNSLQRMRARSGPVVIFGAGHFSVAFLSIMGVAGLISFVVDDNPNKAGLLMPVGGLKVFGSSELYSGHVKMCLLGLNPISQPAVISRHNRFCQLGGVFSSIFCGDENYLGRLKR